MLEEVVDQVYRVLPMVRSITHEQILVPSHSQLTKLVFRTTPDSLDGEQALLLSTLLTRNEDSPSLPAFHDDRVLFEWTLISLRHVLTEHQAP